MKAMLHSARIAPKKANLIARMVRGLSVPEAMDQLHRTNKKAARMMEMLLRSAIANASHNDRQDAQTMIVKTVVVNQGQAYHRGMPMARGRTRPFRKFLSHISLTLGFPDVEGEEKGKNQKAQGSKKIQKMTKEASQESKTPVKKASSEKKQKDVSKKKSSDSSESSVSSAS
jgi:large subunit ribosomal protein L22